MMYVLTLIISHPTAADEKIMLAASEDVEKLKERAGKIQIIELTKLHWREINTGLAIQGEDCVSQVWYIGSSDPEPWKSNDHLYIERVEHI